MPVNCNYNGAVVQYQLMAQISSFNASEWDSFLAKYGSRLCNGPSVSYIRASLINLSLDCIRWIKNANGRFITTDKIDLRRYLEHAPHATAFFPQGPRWSNILIKMSIFLHARSFSAYHQRRIKGDLDLVR